MSYVGEERAKLEAANVERDSDLAQLLLDHGHHQARVLIGGSLHGDVEAHAIHRGISGGVEQLLCLAGIVVIGWHVAVVCPALRGKNAARGLRLPAPEILNHRLAVEGIGDRLAHSHIFQNRIAQIESQIGQNGSGCAVSTASCGSRCNVNTVSGE